MRPEFLLTLLVALAPAALAAATPPVGDTPLPTLAPMINKVSPAVVNIATRGTIRERSPQNPLFDDPFFRRFFDALLECSTSELLQRSAGSGVYDATKYGCTVAFAYVVQYEVNN